MIEYETTDSSFFKENEKYCKNIESKLKPLKTDISGYCNCYGYEFKALFEKEDLSFEIKFIKNQTTQNGVVTAVDAHEYAGIEINIRGLQPEYKMTVVKSSLLRYFCSSEYKDKIPEPYYIKLRDFQNYHFTKNLVKTIVDNRISKIRIKNGKFFALIDEPSNDSITLIKDIECIIKNLYQ